MGSMTNREANEVIKLKKTYRLENNETQEVLEEGWSDARLQFSYNNNGEINTITKVAATTITDTEVSFRFLNDNGFIDDNRRSVTISSNQLINWKIKVADYYLVNERTNEEIQAGRCDALLALAYCNDDGERDVITKIGVEDLTDTEATFYFLDSYKTISIPIDKIIDWIL